MKTFATIFCVICGLLASAQNKPEPWKTIRFFEGNWEGTGTMQDTEGKYERSYRFIYNGTFLEVRNKSTYQPTATKPESEIHEDLGYISFDKSRKKFILRQFHIEGFVNQYVADSVSTDGKTLVFTTEAIENIPPGWKARETYHIISENEFTETFELAAPNQGFERYSQVKLTRK